MRGRLIAISSLFVPVAAGLGYFCLWSAPGSYLAIQAAGLVVAVGLIGVMPAIASRRVRRGLLVSLVALLFAPPLVGPEINSITRWLAIGPFVLHSGMLLIPSIVVLAAREDDNAAPLLLLALLACQLQPDAASGMAICFAAIGRYDAVRDWRMGVVAAVAFVASLEMAMRGELPAQPFVERVIVAASIDSPLFGAILLAALLAGFFLMLKAVPGARAERHALAGSLFGFGTVALIANYPTPLVGYGAAPILGYGLALAILAGVRRPRHREDSRAPSPIDAAQQV